MDKLPAFITDGPRRPPAKRNAKRSKAPAKKKTVAVVDIAPEADIAEARREPIEVEGGKARRRLDRPARKGYAGGGGVTAPGPSLKFASDTGIGVDEYRHMTPLEVAKLKADAPSRATGGRVHLDAGAGGGKGRIDKATAYGSNAKRKG